MTLSNPNGRGSIEDVWTGSGTTGDLQASRMDRQRQRSGGRFWSRDATDQLALYDQGRRTIDRSNQVQRAQAQAMSQAMQGPGGRVNPMVAQRNAGRAASDIGQAYSRELAQGQVRDGMRTNLALAQHRESTPDPVQQGVGQALSTGGQLAAFALPMLGGAPAAVGGVAGEMVSPGSSSGGPGGLLGGIMGGAGGAGAGVTPGMSDTAASPPAQRATPGMGATPPLPTDPRGAPASTPVGPAGRPWSPGASAAVGDYNFAPLDGLGASPQSMAAGILQGYDLTPLDELRVPRFR